MTTNIDLDNSDDVLVDPTSISAKPGAIRGMTESEYLLGAVAVVQQELESSQRRFDIRRMVDAVERVDNLKDCLITALRKEKNMTTDIATTTVSVSLDLGKYSINQLYNMLQLGLLTRAEYLAELDRRVDADGFLHF